MVDLCDPAITQAHPRFAERVCTDQERSRIMAADDPTTLLWSLFAAKEAAYKVVIKLGETPTMAHRKFEVDADMTTVRFRDHTLHLSVDVSPERVHAIVSTDAALVAGHVAATPEGEPPGQAARRLLCTAVAEQLQCDATELEVVRTPVPGSWDGYGPPRLHDTRGPIQADVSLSHDGRFVAFAITGATASR